MKKYSPFMQGFDQLPDTLAIFPLNNAVVMPGSHLPLNIFEPRYLNMIQDAMESHRLIGMIQPRDNSQKPSLFKIGCAARITRYEEIPDGRIEISLTGLCRFEIDEEIVTTRGYRLVVPQWDKYVIDFDEESVADDVHQAFLNSLKLYFNNTKFDLEWDVMDTLSAEILFNSLYCFIDIAGEDKQMLLEIDTLEQRIKALTAILNSNQQNEVIRH